jgi:hypothetical protein
MAPHMSKEDIMKMNYKTKIEKEHFFDESKRAKENYVKSLTSNIFNDPVFIIN